MIPNLASQMRTAFSNMACKHWLKIAGRTADDLKHLRGRCLLLQRFAKSRVSRATSVPLPAGDELEPAGAFGALRRFGSGAFDVVL